MIWIIRWIIFKSLVIFGAMSKYIKTDDIKRDAKEYGRSKLDAWLNFDEFKEKAPEFGISSQVSVVSGEKLSKHTEIKPKKNDEFTHIKEENINNYNNRIYRDETTKDRECVLEPRGTPIMNSTNLFEERLKDIDDIDLDHYRYPEERGNPKAEKSVLVLDDLGFMVSLYHNIFNKIDRTYNVDSRKDFKYLWATDQDCACKVLKYIDNDEVRIDYALLDITLGHVNRTRTGKPIELDGVDIALILLKRNPNMKFKFITAHSLNRYQKTLQIYFDKFEKNTKLNIDNYFINKNGDQVTPIYKLLYEDRECGND